MRIDEKERLARRLAKVVQAHCQESSGVEAVVVQSTMRDGNVVIDVIEHPGRPDRSFQVVVRD